ncbi:MAG: DNA polymerase III subunit alpha [Candidatus Melainabacteria bacterium]|nr:DNA polymerase III subunit alpha [Candidatus Melainabacteria bacterium]
MPRPYVPLHLHTEYSLLDGATRIKDLVKKAKAENMPAVAITDHGVMYGAVELTKACYEIGGVKPILGYEAYIIDGDIEDKKTKQNLHHLTIIAQNKTGYQNLVKLVSRAHIKGFYYKPRINKQMLAEFSEGLVVLSGCLGAELAQLLLKDKYEEARASAAWYKEVLGENYYLEIQDHGYWEDRKVNRQIVKLSRELGIKLVSTNDSHFTNKGDAQSHDCLLCIQMGKVVTDTNRMKFSGWEYIKNGDEMSYLFRDHLDPEMIEESIKSTLEIADRVEPVKLGGPPRLPVLDMPHGHTAESYLNDLVFAGVKERCNGSIPPEYEARAKMELECIESKKFASYFLMTADFIKFARDRDIPVGPGRGSAAGSLVAYALGITNIDPIKYNLLFERFLNPERESMPDIDTDFCIDRRDEVIKYCAEKYGVDRVAQIITFNRMTSKAVIKDVARVLEYPFSESTKLAKMVPVVRGKPTPLKDMLIEHPEFKKTYQTSDEAKEVIDIAQQLEGTNKTYGMHAAGVVISDVPLEDLVPVQRNNDGTVIAQFYMEDCAYIGLVKMDFLGLRNLTMIDKACKIIKNTTGTSIIPDEIPLDDEKTFQTISNGDLAGIFQLETSSGMRQVARDMKPSNMEDISALIALYRPGPLDSGMIEKFIDCKNGKTKITYETPLLAPILKDTYGQIVYQEQVMQIAQQLGGYSLGQADLLRRAMGKKKPEEMEKHRSIFISGCTERSIDSGIADKLFDTMVQFAEYCFNKSHSAAYGMLTYQTAYLKTHYPVPYMTALMSSVAGEQDKVQGYIAECQAMNIEILPPDVNVSTDDFTADGPNIRFGLSGVKNVGEAAVAEIVKKREEGGPYKSIHDFLARIDLRTVNKRTMEALIKCGACLNLGITRKQALENLESLVETAARRQSSEATGQMSLFSFGGNDKEDEDSGIMKLDIQLKGDGSEFEEAEMQIMEHELLGFYVTSHPLNRVANRLKYLTTHSIKELKESSDGTSTIIGGLANSVEKRLTKQNKLLGIVHMEDLSSKCEVILYADLLEKLGPDILQAQALLLVKGKVKKFEDNFSITAQSIRRIADASMVDIVLGKEPSFSDMHRLKDILNLHKGEDPVMLHFRIGKSSKVILVGSQFWVSASPELLTDLKSNFTDALRVSSNRVRA